MNREKTALSELRELVYQHADAFHTNYLLAGANLLEIGLRYVRFAKEEPRLFCLLFQSGHFDGSSLQDLIRAPEAAPLLAAAQLSATEDAEAVARRFEALFVVVHGYASLIANNAMPYDPDAIRATLTAIHAGLTRDGDQP